ncbi:hypothetical protein KPH14_004767 [Odynerus spinipes]|uniref:MD-2-related lipid-recognition domain-containing protein n=1 Tax=Odynerus spinipes TaxID=1348599 RepID=A0AAD9RMM7_9HYME|nr:hypothetical protein KPH14_004767 [Odynerus spinipes]
MIHLLVLCTFLFVSGVVEVSDAVSFQDCGSKIGRFTAVTVSGCDTTKAACDLVRNTNASLTIDFIPSQDIEKVTAEVYGVIADLPIPFPLSHPDVCADQESNIHCPLKKDTPYSYKAILPVKREYPRLTVQVKWQLKNENKQDIVCVYIPAKIK